jgi:uncharacterized membrane protein
MALQETTFGRSAGRGRQGALAPAARRAPARHSRGNGAAQGRDDAAAERLATGLGWFSIGLGLAELAAPSTVAQLAGIPDDDRNRRVLQGAGLREIVHGVGILSRPKPAGWVWSRVAGDAMDLALLGAAFTSDRTDKNRLAAATAAVVGVTVLDVLCAQRLSNVAADGGGTAAQGGLLARLAPLPLLGRSVHVTKAITIQKPAEEIYRFWRDVKNLPRFMYYLEEVRPIDNRRSHWVAKAPLGRRVEWDSEVIEDVPNRKIAWRSLERADVPNSGVVTFEPAPGGRGTVVRVELQYEPPGGIIGATFAKLLGREPGQEVGEDLRRLKQILEIGEVVESEATIKGWGPAQPPAELPRR